VVKLAYECPQKFEHFGAFIKEDELENMNRIWEQTSARERLPPRKEISGHFTIKML